MPDGQLIEFAHVTKRFGAVSAVSDFSARVEPGVVTGFLGPNGAGKTTTLRMLLGQLTPTSGTATIGGVHYGSLKSPLRAVGAVMEDANYRPRRTALRQLTLAAKANGIPLSRIDEVLALVGLQDDAETRIGTYSLGMRQRLSVATALLGDPGTMILDEPANGLDPEGIRWMRLLMRRLADEGRTVLVSSHVLSEIEQIADQVLVLSKGHLMYSGEISKLADPSAGPVVVDADDRAALAAALSAAGLEHDVLRSGLTVRGSDSATVGAAAATAGVALTTLLQRGPTLEDVFLDLVHGRREIVSGAVPAASVLAPDAGQADAVAPLAVPVPVIGLEGVGAPEGEAAPQEAAAPEEAEVSEGAEVSEEAAVSEGAEDSEVAEDSEGAQDSEDAESSSASAEETHTEIEGEPSEQARHSEEAADSEDSEGAETSEYAEVSEESETPEDAEEAEASEDAEDSEGGAEELHNEEDEERLSGEDAPAEEQHIEDVPADTEDAAPFDDETSPGGDDHIASETEAPVRTGPTPLPFATQAIMVPVAPPSVPSFDELLLGATQVPMPTPSDPVAPSATEEDADWSAPSDRVPAEPGIDEADAAATEVFENEGAPIDDEAGSGDAAHEADAATEGDSVAEDDTEDASGDAVGVEFFDALAVTDTGLIDTVPSGDARSEENSAEESPEGQSAEQPISPDDVQAAGVSAMIAAAARAYYEDEPPVYEAGAGEESAHWSISTTGEVAEVPADEESPEAASEDEAHPTDSGEHHDHDHDHDHDQSN